MQINVKPVNKARIFGVNSSTVADVVLVSIVLDLFNNPLN